MVKSRKSKYILVVAMALCLVMAFSASAFAGVNASGTVSVSISDILSSFQLINENTVFADWRPDSSPFTDTYPPVSMLNTLYYSNGFATTSYSDFSRIQSILSNSELGQSYEWYIYTVTGIEDLFSRVYVDSSPVNKQSSNINAKLRAIEYFSGKEISYFYNATLGLVLCNLSNQPILYVNDASVTQKEVANIPVQAGGDNVLNEDNRKYYYDNSVVNNITEIYEGDTITYENETIINEGDTITTNNYDYGQTIEGDLIDINGGTLNMPNGDIYQIEDYIYNEDNDTYYYSTTNNNQTYNFTVQYYYEYTYVIYLGSSEEYAPEAYKFYYELPDGRSSADLTADELAGMSVQFADVVTYDRVPSDEIVKGLFHLDGDLENSTVYDGVEMFFTSGASITYQEVANFNGALYLPALTGVRQINIPTSSGESYSSNIANQGSDFTTSSGNSRFKGLIPMKDGFSLDFRFYSYADSGDTSEYLYFDGFAAYESFNSTSQSTDVIGGRYYDWLSLNGNSLKIRNTTISVSVGTWNHFLINFYLKKNSYYYDLYGDFYLNGVLVASNIQIAESGANIDDDDLDSALFRGFRLKSSSNTVPFMLDEIRITSANVPNLVSPVSYEDNLVWVLPDSTNLAANTLAIQSDYLSGKYRVGGIRPSMVEKGHVWFQISMNRITSCQVYNGIMWEEVNCYVWTGSRWIPANYFDVVTLTDYYDIADNTGLPTITTSEGFFSWFQREFKEFKDKAIAFFDAWEGGSGGQGGSTNNNVTIIAPSLTANGTLDANISIDNKFEFDLGTNAGDVLQGGFEGVSGVFRGMWQLGGSLFDTVGDSVTYLFEFLTPTGGSDIITIPVDFWFIGFN